MPVLIPAPYHSADTKRFFLEPEKSQSRNPFQRDRARILHSSALRRLGAKTQVLGAGTNDFSRTRLTHSLEVAQVGRDIANELGCNPDIVDAACLSHDLGHPPFGHNGEKILDSLCFEIGGFEGNAQTLRLLTRLEPKIFNQVASFGLNLTKATLDASIKYPWRRANGPDPSSTKFGVYEDDLEVFHWAREGAIENQKCIEAQVMDIADDIAYSVHDIEDAITFGSLKLADLKEPGERETALKVVKDWYAPELSLQQLDEALERLENIPIWITNYDASPKSQAELKNMTSELIGRFVSAVVLATREQYGNHALARYNASVVVPTKTQREIAVLKGLAARYVMNSDSQKHVYGQQAQIITDLFAFYTQTGSAHLDPIYSNLYHQAKTDTAKQRVIVDQIAALTDVSATRIHGKYFDSGLGILASIYDQPLPGLGPDLT